MFNVRNSLVPKTVLHNLKTSKRLARKGTIASDPHVISCQPVTAYSTETHTVIILQY
jgi:hypothetical protein